MFIVDAALFPRGGASAASGALQRAPRRRVVDCFSRDWVAQRQPHFVRGLTLVCRLDLVCAHGRRNGRDIVHVCARGVLPACARNMIRRRLTMNRARPLLLLGREGDAQIRALVLLSGSRRVICAAKLRRRGAQPREHPIRVVWNLSWRLVAQWPVYRAWRRYVFVLVRHLV